ncbi:hypothetical protein HY485_02585, partial [Candidatus Woesearchaeota archaeon]|nr:hypothetical protein [Candidatus Woesearchaeota archaeon]
SEVKTIKDVDNETWARFKELASENNSNMGPFFKTMLKEYEKTTKIFWKDILTRDKILSDKEAEEFGEITKNVREEYGFRE